MASDASIPVRRGKRRYCGYVVRRQDGIDVCDRSVEWLTTHVARCSYCAALWWWEPGRVGAGRRWQSGYDDPHAMARIAAELALDLRGRLARNAEGGRILALALPEPRRV